ncbi:MULTISPECIES: nitrate/nitrite transporter [Corynebacterium]|uniref:nitrate/nitrite transporter n=1 Tax=Corynebacterium TaxID=1716 RepID=UPI00065F8995|nr:MULTISPECIES: nitrate/nitrite transporter [Corynebacterium]MBC6794000.1 NarK/NasA family nitrate transporter [Corynebacterium sp. LK26]MCQ9172243.1 NarK/NasA family nitrate transporter [Corynebacterium amycolatum]MDK8828658.1 nitrate/nitrite transporter [Corynebacterium sp. MSK012]OMQ10752.1 MFS transporter [Corynebacterium amycolatum]
MEPLDTSGKVIKGWDPENPAHWDSKIAWKTLTISTIALIIGFATWYLVSAIAPMLNRIGFDLTAGQLYWLTSIAGLSCGLFRLVFMFLPPIIGTRKLVTLSSFLFVIPMLGWYFAVQNTDTPYWWLLTLSFLSGIGGGVFSGFMPSTGYFFPKRMSGTALGIQAGIGNFGISLIQLVGPWLMGFSLLGLGFVAPMRTDEGHDVFVYNPAIVLVPWTIIMGIVAWTMLKDVPIRANFREQIDIFGNKNTWILTIVYLVTFGAFSGFAAQLALLTNDVFGANSKFAETYALADLPQGAKYAFLGPLIGALVRALWGPLCDKYGGAIWTFIGCAGMTIFTGVAAIFLTPDSPDEYGWFLGSMLIMFFFTGLGNAGTFKQMPMILPRRQAGGVIGWTGAIGAFGPFIVGVLLSVMAPVAFFWGCVVFFAFTTVLVWIYYARPNAPFPG